MSGSYLLDTNIIIGLFAKDKKIINHLLKVKSVFIPSIVIGELFYGANNSIKIKANVEKINQLHSESNVLDITSITGDYYGQVKKDLKTKGTPIPENDIWIAAIALQYGLTLATRDKHFGKIEGIKVTNW
jgi:tRNA(fMet)-specific endonuclease VapC